jgi:hypothetical protein
MEDILKILGIIILIIFVSIIFIQSFYFKEGLETSSSSSTNNPILNGYAGNAKSFAETIKSLSVKLSDKLIVSKYRTDYENIIINMEDYISLIMLDIIFSLNTSSSQVETIKLLNDLGTLKTSKDALNDSMKYLDSMKG